MISPNYLPKEKRWKFRYTYYDDAGIRREKVFSSSKQGEAGKREVIAKYRAWKGNSFEFVWSKYIESKKARLGETSKSVRNEVSIGNIYLLPKFSGQAIDYYKIQDYQEFINNLRLQNGELPSRKYLQTTIATINSFLTWAWEAEYLYEPLRGKLYLPKDREVKSKSIPTLEEFQKIVMQEDGYWYKEYIIFLFCTGLRPSEALLLTDDCIVDNIAYIKGGLLRDRTISTGKTKNSVRAVPLCDLALEQIAKMHQKAPKGSKYIFCNTEGNPVRQANAYKELLAMCKKLGIQPLSLYSARHFFVTYTADALGQSALKHTVGHSEVFDGLNVYSHSNRTEQEQIRDTLNGVFSNQNLS